MANSNKIPTNIITGFLGVGKTTVISHLLAHKPEHERWAVLVNEFGEVGIDGSLFQSDVNIAKDVFIREVPGGCMCCAAGVPVNVALVEILRKIKPDRLLIEPSGLGHLAEVLDVLQSEQFREHINLGHTMTLVDARNLSDQRYTSHETFKQQLALADIIVASKADCYQKGETERLNRWLAMRGIRPKLVTVSANGHLPATLLSKQSFTQDDGVIDLDHTSMDELLEVDDEALTNRTELKVEPLSAQEVIKYINQGDGYFAYGWRLGLAKQFDLTRLQALLAQISAYRVKAVVQTDKGIARVNQTLIDVVPKPDNFIESKIEIICYQEDIDLEKQLMDCLAK